MRRMTFTGSSVFGIVLIAVGVVSLLGGLNYFDSWDIFSTYWPMVIVLFGVKHMIDHRSSTMFGFILILIGAFLQVDQLNLWYLGDINIRELIIPVIIILVGFNFILPKRRMEEADTGANSEKAQKAEEAPEAPVKPEAATTVSKETAENNLETGEIPEQKAETESVDGEIIDADFVDSAE